MPACHIGCISSPMMIDDYIDWEQYIIRLLVTRADIIY